ncbi:MAG: hypothetical protein K0R93_1523 [Anaerosolibacter sp.]|jgi:hypothetical protein|uniref:hypothetical protein n=1 Tax=Anaerosolibacter sp. TaxID=1872527 RepID=UPI002616DD04|nr:hypothetical protein [Anaerosolibacter sp.]MDF2546625.1 hypothetical protein [Anaerosolibacter sp.]
MEKDFRPQPQPEANKADQNQNENPDIRNQDTSMENESLFHRLGEVNVMPDGMLSPVDETAYVNSIINENATEIDDETRSKK